MKSISSFLRRRKGELIELFDCPLYWASPNAAVVGYVIAAHSNSFNSLLLLLHKHISLLINSFFTFHSFFINWWRAREMKWNQRRRWVDEMEFYRAEGPLAHNQQKREEEQWNQIQSNKCHNLLCLMDWLNWIKRKERMKLSWKTRPPLSLLVFLYSIQSNLIN